MPSMFAALAVAFLLQDTPAELFKKVEAKYESAKTLSLASEVRILEMREGKEVVRGSMQGKFKSKGDGRIHVEYSVMVDGKPTLVATYISDGKALSMKSSGRAAERKEDTLALGLWARRFCARTGLTASMGSAFGAVFRSDEFKLDKLFLVSEIADGGKEKVGDVECRIVTYQVSQVQPGADPLKCRMWVDPAKLAVLKHEIVDKAAIIRETHSEVTFDAELADEVFKVQ
jgi:outer membrane lipoprotein-sorting protein